ncbi:hypothetical protein [Nonomuraea salmonea]|uniref:hypothetical protein n=1 Tax=Nonomuraea salmonea TaxID=46181 RepID=UPI0031E717FD
MPAAPTAAATARPHIAAVRCRPAARVSQACTGGAIRTTTRTSTRGSTASVTLRST